MSMNTHEKQIDQKMKEKPQSPPSALDMLKISLGLTVACFFAALIIGGVFYFTEPVKIQNLAKKETLMLAQLLDLQGDARVMEIRRYLSWNNNQLEILYATDHKLIRLDQDGQEITVYEFPESVVSGEDKDLWAKMKMDEENRKETNFVGRFFIGFQGDERTGYVIEGSSMGYKDNIGFFVSLDIHFGLKGIEITHHIEDPGLGAEITEDYFKNQFAGRSREMALNMSVVRMPLPDDWAKALNEKAKTDLNSWKAKHDSLINENKDIYAITGATISAQAVADGVQRALKSFQQRMNQLEPYL